MATDPNDPVFYVYKLIDPRNNQIFYIGKGVGRRAYNHFLESQIKHQNNTMKNNKIKSIQYDGFAPIIEYIKENITDSEAKDLEINLIKEYGRVDKGTGILTNMTDGGDGFAGRIKTPEERDKLRKRSYYKDPEYLKKQSESQRKRYAKGTESQLWKEGRKPRDPSSYDFLKIKKGPNPEHAEKMRAYHAKKRLEREQKS